MCAFDYNFSVMVDDNPVIIVRANVQDRVAEFERLTDNWNILPPYLYGLSRDSSHEPDFEWLEKFIKHRTFPKERINCLDILAWLGLDKYDIWDITKLTHGVSSDDFFWLKFEGETLTQKELMKAYEL